MKQYLNRRCILYFAKLFLCILLITCTSVGLIFAYGEGHRRIDYEKTLDMESERVFSYLKMQLNAGIHTCNGMMTSVWYNHYVNYVGIYSNEFDGEKHNELRKTLTNSLAALPIVDEIVVIVPSKDTVISSKGWFSLKIYAQTYPTIKVLVGRQGDAPHVQIDDGTRSVIEVQDPTPRRNKSIMALFINNAAICSAYSSLCGSTAMGADITINGTVASRYDSANEKMIVHSLRDDSSQLDLVIYYAPYTSADRVLFIALFSALVVISALFAMIITMLTVKPVNELVMQIGGDSKAFDDPLRFIHEYVNTFTQNREKLDEENNRLRASKDRFLELMHNEIVLGMLRNQKFDFTADFVTTMCPWISEGLPFVVAAYSRMKEEPQITAEEICPESIKRCWANTETERWFLFWFKDEAALEAGVRTIKARLEGNPVVVSEKMNDLSQISATSADMLRELEELRMRWLMLPMLIQTRLVSRIRLGKREEALEALDEALAGHSPDAVLWTLARLSGECGFDIDEYVERCRIGGESGTYDYRSILRECVLDLCRFMTAERNSNIGSDSSKDILAYINENFRNPDLSVVLLGDEFGMHRTLISKTVKTATGETFSDYLLRLRMECAEKLLIENEGSVQSIGTLVGIPNYTTFKRSFVKVYGISPREYRELKTGVGVPDDPEN